MILEMFNVFAIATVERIGLWRNLVKQFQEIIFIARCDSLFLLVMISYPVQIFARQLPLIQGLQRFITGMLPFFDKPRLVIHRPGGD